jgi:hypothetical protein
MRCLWAVQPVPGNEEQQLLVALAQRLESSHHHGVVIQAVRSFCALDGSVRCEPIAQRDASSLDASPVCQHATRDPEQPGELLGRCIVEPTPRNDEDVGDNIICGGRRDPPMHERAHSSALRPV